MGNMNSLISLAYLKVNDNPLHVFCQYIRYLLLKSPSHQLRPDELNNGLQNEFGLRMPPQVIANCIRMMSKSGEVTRLPKSAGYAIGNTNFDIEKFEDTRRRLHVQEEEVLKSLVEFVNERYKKQWSTDEAKRYLSDFLDKEGYGSQIFLQKEVSVESAHISPSLYIGRYINYIQKNEPDSLVNEYLKEIVNGMMIFQGLHQTDDYQQHQKQKFKGTVFYFDTKLVLRALGFSWGAQVESVREMVRLLREKYDARIGIFQQTMREVRNALISAGNSYKHHTTFQDLELRLYAELNPGEAGLLSEYSQNLEALLSRHLGIKEITYIDRGSPDATTYNIEVTQIVDYIEKKHGWRRGAIEFDAEVINQINILRKGNYTVPYGGKSALPVFVTSNAKLSYAFRDYIMETESENGKGDWNSHALPVISDNMLLYRIWLPYANEYSNLPALTLSRFAYAAQSEGAAFFEKFRTIASSMEKLQDIDLLSTTEATRNKIEDILIASTDGDLDRIDDIVVANSLDEFNRLDKLSLTTENESLKQEKKILSGDIQKIMISQYSNKIGFWNRVLLFVARFWWVFGMGILYVALSKIQSIPYLQYIFLAPLVIKLLGFVLDKTIDDNGWRFKPYKYASHYVKHRYIKNWSRRFPSWMEK